MLTSLLLFTMADAFACGGFFCNPQQPVYQAGEEIVFAVDEEACEVRTHVAIQYEGAAEDFAWIVPVSGEPDLFTSSSAIFDAIRQVTDPTYTLQTDINGMCEVPLPRANFAAMEDASAEFEDGVTVHSESRVGPYDTVVLQALNADVLLTWLDNEGYDIPANLVDVLQPYTADNQYFVALKLASGQDVGDLTPLGMAYPGCGGSVPLQLTSVAANDDMPVDVYVLGEARAVPDNYLHVTLNDASIDWWTSGANFSDVISRAADEAGGQAFATTYSGANTAQIFDGSIVPPAANDYPPTYVSALTAAGVPMSSEVVAVLADYVPYPTELADGGVNEASFYACMDCWWVDADYSLWDAEAVAARIEVDVLPGIEAAQADLDRFGHLTRLTTTMDADEMTADPVFVFNRDLPQEVSNQRTAEQKVNCAVFEGQQGAERKLILEDGRKIKLPSVRWMNDRGLTEIELIDELTSPAAILIEDFSAEGEGEIVFDYREDALRDARRFGRPGCACTSAPSPLSLLALGLLLPVVARRRE